MQATFNFILSLCFKQTPKLSQTNSVLVNCNGGFYARKENADAHPNA